MGSFEKECMDLYERMYRCKTCVHSSYSSFWGDYKCKMTNKVTGAFICNTCIMYRKREEVGK